MAMTCVSSNTAQTIGGAVATGAHGSSLKFGSISDAIIELVIVMANGEMCHISTSSNAELLDAARVSLGTLGVIYSVTIQCEMAYALQLEDALEPIDEALASIDDQLQRNDHFEMLWFPFTSTVLTRQLNRTELPATPPPSDFLFCVDKDAASKRIARFILKMGTLVPRMVPFLSHFLASRVTSTRDLVSSSHSVFAAMDQRHLGPFQESEFGVSLGDARAAIAELRRFIESQVTQG